MDNKKLKKEMNDLKKQIISILKSNSIEFDENDENDLVKSKIRNYIENISEAEILFEKYAKLAKDICNFDDNNDLPELKKQTIEEENIRPNKKVSEKKKTSKTAKNKENIKEKI